MKKSVLLGLWVILVLLAGVTPVFAENKSAEIDSLYYKVKECEYKIEVNRVSTATVFNTERFNPRGVIEVRDSLVKGNLPFFGKAYRVPYGGDSGIVFEGKAKDMQVEKKKNNVEVRFSTRSSSELLQFVISLFPGGRASVRMNSNDRESANYDGEYVFFNGQKSKVH